MTLAKNPGIISYILVGAIVVIIWIAWIKPLAEINEIFGMYEIIPGFLASVIVTYVVSKMTKKPGDFVDHDIAEVKRILAKNPGIISYIPKISLISASGLIHAIQMITTIAPTIIPLKAPALDI